MQAITVTDNGPGIPAATVKAVLDYSIRVSSREAYVAPDRGAQGNALKTLIAMPFVLNGQRGVTGTGAVKAHIVPERRHMTAPISSRASHRSKAPPLRPSAPTPAQATGRDNRRPRSSPTKTF